MDDERLLELIRKYPVIYDIYHPKYLDNKYKNSVWSIISQELQQTDDTCRKRWANIRDQFRKTLNKRMIKGDQGATHFKKYKYERILNFLIPYLNASRDKELKTINVEDESNVEAQAPCQSPLLTISPILTTTIDSEAKPTTQLTRKRRRLLPQSQSASSAMMEFIKYNERTQNDPIDAFFNGLAATVKKFSPYYQHIAKGKIFSVVQGLEWEQLAAVNSAYKSPMSETSTNSTPMYEFVPMPILSPTQSTSIPLEPTPLSSTSVKTEFPPADESTPKLDEHLNQ